MSIAPPHDTFVNRLALDLRARGLSVWYDQWELDVGNSLFERIQAALTESRWLVIVLSPNSVGSPWVQEELNAMYVHQLAARRVHILPVLYCDCELPAFLRNVPTKLVASESRGPRHVEAETPALRNEDRPGLRDDEGKAL